MRIDWYSKGVFTVIAVRTVQAQGPLAGVQFTVDGYYPYFFDARTGELWEYDKDRTFSTKYRLNKLGASLIKEK